MKKGILFTMLTILMMLSIFLFAAYFSSQGIIRDISSEKTLNIYDDIRADIEDMVRISVTVNQTADTVAFTDHFPFDNGTGILPEYETFINTTYAKHVNSNITLGNLSNSTFTVLPYGLKYEYNHFNKTILRIYNTSANADDVTGYNSTLVFYENVISITESTSAGALNFYLNATFANDTHEFSGNVARDANSTWFFEFGDSNFTLHVGINSINGEDKNSTLVYVINGTQVDSVNVVEFTSTEDIIGVKSSIYINILDKVKRSDYLWITPPTFEKPTCPQACSIAGYFTSMCRIKCGGQYTVYEPRGNADCASKICCCG